MATLVEQLEEAKANVARLMREIAAARCSDVGHRWVFVGGRNCGCEPDGYCSVPVHRCEVCNDYDYGDNAEAAGVMARCSRGSLRPSAA